MTLLETFYQNLMDLWNWMWNDMTTTQLLLILGGVWLAEKMEPRMRKDADALEALLKSFAETIKNKKARG